jgi:hypothetical protein
MSPHEWLIIGFILGFLLGFFSAFRLVFFCLSVVLTAEELTYVNYKINTWSEDNVWRKVRRK